MNIDVENFIAEKLNVAFQTVPLTGDAGTRQYFKIKSELDSKYILCAYKKDELTSFDYFLNINKMFRKHDINTPNVVHASKNLGLMILEDLGKVTLEGAFKEKLNLTFYQKAIDALIKIQNIKKHKGSIAHSYAFDIKKLNWEFNFSLKHMTSLYSLDIKCIDTVKLKKEFNSISTHLYSLPQVVTHRDYHSRNLIVKNNEVYVIDFQDARLGSPFYDLTSLIEDTYTNLPIKTKNILIQYYLSHSNISFDENFNKNYNLQALQRSFKACGSFARLKNIIKINRYLKYLAPSILNIKTYLKEFKNYPEFLKFINLCSKKEGL